MFERSLAYRVVVLKRRLRRQALGERGLPPLAAVLSRHEAIQTDPLYRRWVRFRGGQVYRALRGGRKLLRRGREAPAGAAPAPAGPPALPEHLSRRVDEALDFLRLIPWEEIQRRGWHFQPRHFYWPLNDVEFLAENEDLWHGRGVPRGIDWRIDEQLDLARTASAYRHELDDVPSRPQPGRVEFVWENNAFGGADAVIHYGLMREWKPRRVLEIGCGWSSLLLERAIRANGTPTSVIQIEPFPNNELLDVLPAEWERHASIVQHADLALFERLEPGDVLFYDGSHCVATGSDVNWLFFEVLPRLAPGVRIHVHDLFFPDDYHDEWIYDEGLSWNEQYLMQAFMMHNDSYRVLLANHLLFRERWDQIEELHGMDGGSVWLEKLR